MKTLYYVLVLFIISTGYLFSQSEENETIKVDTVIKKDTVVVEQQEKKDFKKNDFYNDYLHSLPKTNDTFAIDDNKKTGIISAKAECTFFFLGGSVIWNMPLRYYSNITFASKCLLSVEGGSDDGISTCFGLGLGYVNSESANTTLRVNIYPVLWTNYHKYTNNTFVYGLNLGGDIIFGNIFSIGLDAIGFKDHTDMAFIMFLNMGLNIVY